MPPPAVNAPMGGMTPGGKLTADQQKKLLEERRRIPLYVQVLKILSILGAIAWLVTFLALKVHLDDKNTYLEIFGIPDNTATTHSELKKQYFSIQTENTQLEQEIKQKEERIARGSFFEHGSEMEAISKMQKVWFDTYDEKGVLHYGLLEAFKRLEEYFNSPTYGENGEASILLNNKVTFTGSRFSEENISVEVKASNLFSRIFYLSTELVDMVNAYPLFYGAEIKNFRRTEDENGDELMTFSLQLDFQTPDYEDPSDELFTKYEKWYFENRGGETSSGLTPASPNTRGASR